LVVESVELGEINFSFSANNRPISMPPVLRHNFDPTIGVINREAVTPDAIPCNTKAIRIGRDQEILITVLRQ
jgi:hypothetical protein